MCVTILLCNKLHVSLSSFLSLGGLLSGTSLGISGGLHDGSQCGSGDGVDGALVMAVTNDLEHSLLGEVAEHAACKRAAMYHKENVPIDLELFAQCSHSDELTHCWELLSDLVVGCLVEVHGVVELFLYLSLGPFLR